MNRGAETYLGRFTLSAGLGRASATGGTQHVMLRAIDKKAARFANFQLPAEHFSAVDIEQVEHVDAWRDGDILEADLTLKSGKVLTFTIQR